MSIKQDFIWEVKGSNIYLTRVKKITNRQVEGTPFTITNPNQEQTSITFGKIVGIGDDVLDYNIGDIIHFPTVMGMRYFSNGTEYLIIDQKAVTAKLKSELISEIKDDEIFYN